MRHWINLIEQFSLDKSDYGYWITPQGDIQPCSSVDHAELACDQLGIDYDPYDEEQGREAVETAIEEGSVRIVASKGSREFNAEWSEMSITSDARKSLLTVLGLYSTRDFFILQNEMFEDYRKAIVYAKTH